MADDEDFIDRLKRKDAAEAARQRAIAPPSRPHRRTNKPSPGGYAAQALSNETEAVRTASKGTRNDTLNTACFNLGQLVQPGGLDFEQVKRELTSAALDCGLTRKELAAWNLPDRGIRDGMKRLRNLDDVATGPTASKAKPKDDEAKADWDDDERSIFMRRASTIKSVVPMWVWEYENVGRIQLGTLTMFAGKPASGKSTAVRWFAARLSRGELPGVWKGYPMNVALISSEEQADAMIIPSLQAADADLDRIVLPEFRYGGVESAMMGQADEDKLTEELRQYECRVLFIDPIMSTIGAKTDVYRNNEIRQALAPFTRIARAINGIVIGVAHLRKGDVVDVLGSLNGSSAFGEVPRAVFGFAPMDAGAHVMEQVKNSAGPTDLKLEYHLPIKYLTADDGQQAELPCFEIKGRTEISISDIATNTDEVTGVAAASDWLKLYLLENQPRKVTDVLKDAQAAAAIGQRMLARASKRLGVVSKSQPEPNKPAVRVWMLPEFAKDFGRF